MEVIRCISTCGSSMCGWKHSVMSILPHVRKDRDSLNRFKSGDKPVTGPGDGGALSRLLCGVVTVVVVFMAHKPPVEGSKFIPPPPPPLIAKVADKPKSAILSVSPSSP